MAAPKQKPTSEELHAVLDPRDATTWPAVGINKSHAALYATKMLGVMKAIRSIDKDGTNTHFKYAFAQDMDVLHAVRTALAENGLAISCSIVEHDKSGKSTIVTCEYTFMDAETGYCKTERWMGEADDAQDKGLNKAVTACTKYFLLKTFLIPTGLTEDDPDSQAPVPAMPRSISPEELERNAKMILSRTCKLDKEQFKRFRDAYPTEWVKLTIAAEGDGVKSFDSLMEYAAGLEALENQ